MRIAVLIVVCLLVAGCTRATVSRPEAPQPTGSASSRTPSPASAQPVPSPHSGAELSEVISWIEAGRPADAADYHRATRDDETTDLGDDVAFTTPEGPAGASNPVTCMTDSAHTASALACLGNLTDPAPRPTAAYGEWKGNWVDFDGTTLQVGSAHGDPGPFRNGDGPELPAGAALSFDDFRCRADRVDLFCVNYAHRSAARIGPAGVEPFGCLHPVPPPEGVGTLFRC